MSVDTFNLGSNGDGMVSLNNPYVPPPPPVSNESPPKMSVENEDKRRNMLEKNIDNKQITMDSTPISDLVDSYPMGGMEPPAPSADPRMQSLTMTAPQPPSNMVPQQGQEEQQKNTTQNKNPFNLTDDQMEALLVGLCAAIAISKPVQEKLATTVPRFMNDMGGRSAIGLASTGLVAAVVYYIIQRYIFKK